MSVRLRANAIATILGVGAAVLYRFPPAQYGFYPHCPVFRYGHFYCPGCGLTRALAALLHGQFADAVHYNALAVVLIPCLLVYFTVTYWAAVKDNRFDWPVVPAWCVNLIVLGALLFGVFRNINHATL